MLMTGQNRNTRRTAFIHNKAYKKWPRIEPGSLGKKQVLRLSRARVFLWTMQEVDDQKKTFSNEYFPITNSVWNTRKKETVIRNNFSVRRWLAISYRFKKKNSKTWLSAFSWPLYWIPAKEWQDNVISQLESILLRFPLYFAFYKWLALKAGLKNQPLVSSSLFSFYANRHAGIFRGRSSRLVMNFPQPQPNDTDLVYGLFLTNEHFVGPFIRPYQLYTLFKARIALSI
jgi:hypothetical protein